MPFSNIKVIAERASRFLGDRSGQVAFTFGLAALPLLLVVGSATDYSRAVAVRSNLQQATDATVLAMTHSYLSSTSTGSSLMTPTQTYLTGVMGTVAPTTTTITVNGRTGTLNAATVTSITLSQNNTQMCIATSMIIPTYLMTIVNYKYMATSATACSQTANTYEIALALDNSGSMSHSAGGASKMDSLKSAASTLVDILIPNSSTTTTSIAVVPFTAMVNVGTDTNATFLDKNGASTNHWQNFHRPSKASFLPKSKFELFGALKNATWGGCVEERPSPYMTNDAAPDTATPDTLFVPFFAPDDPGASNSTGSYGCWPYACNDRHNYPFDQSTAASGHNHKFTNSYIDDGGASSAGSNCPTNTKLTSGDSLYYQLDNNLNSPPPPPPNGPDGSVAGPTLYPGAAQTMLCKYNGASVQYSGSSGSVVGPNNGCPASQITPLTNVASTVKTAINNMNAAGSTNLTSGFMWGWRSISPKVNPFPVASPSHSGPQNPKPYDMKSPQNTKIIIFMTDGFNAWGLQSSGSNPDYYNTFTPNRSDYEGFGYFANERLSAYYSVCNASATTQSSYRCLMDQATRDACKNAYNAGIIVYTIGFSVAGDEIDDQGLSLLKDCAYRPNFYYPATDSASIKSAFQQIAQSIQTLRLSQ